MKCMVLEKGGGGEGGHGEVRVSSEEAGAYVDLDKVLIGSRRAASRDLAMK